MYMTQFITEEVQKYISKKLLPLAKIRRPGFCLYNHPIIFLKYRRPSWAKPAYEELVEAFKIQSAREKQKQLRGISPDYINFNIAFFGQADPDMPPLGYDYSKLWKAVIPDLKAIQDKPMIFGTGGEVTNDQYFKNMWLGNFDKEQINFFTPAYYEKI